MKQKILIFAVLLALLSGCTAPAAETVEKEVEITRIVEQTKIVKETVIITQIVEITSTPISPIPTPLFAAWTIKEAQNAIISASLEFVNPTEMTKDDYGTAPMTADQAIRFLVPSICSDCGGRLFTFTSQENLDLMFKYYDELGKKSALFFTWVFVKDNVLIQINGDLPESISLEYQAALNAIKH
jgi:hypothetical protein